MSNFEIIPGNQAFETRVEMIRHFQDKVFQTLQGAAGLFEPYSRTCLDSIAEHLEEAAGMCPSLAVYIIKDMVHAGTAFDEHGTTFVLGSVKGREYLTPVRPEQQIVEFPDLNGHKE